MLPDTSRDKAKRHIVITGCDDQTDVRIRLTDDELAVVERLAKATKRASDSGCQPVIQVVKS